MTVNNVDKPASFFTGLKILSATFSAKVLIEAPISTGNSTVIKSGFRSDITLNSIPLTRSGANMGINRDVPIAATGMKAPAKTMSPCALGRSGGRKGAHGARLPMNNTIMYVLSRGSNRVIRYAIAGPITQPNPKVSPRNFGISNYSDHLAQIHLKPHTEEVRNGEDYYQRAKNRLTKL